MAAVQSIQLWRGACSRHPQGCFPTIHLGSCHLYAAFSTIHIRGHVHKWHIDCWKFRSHYTQNELQFAAKYENAHHFFVCSTSFRSPQIATRTLSCFICSLLAPKSAPERNHHKSPCNVTFEIGLSDGSAPSAFWDVAAVAAIAERVALHLNHVH